MTVMAAHLAPRPSKREVLQSLSASAQRTAATPRTALGQEPPRRDLDCSGGSSALG